jgi:predicted MPP superfamily phosphohydrolase
MPLPPLIRTLGPKGRWFQHGSPAGFEWTLVTLPIRDLPSGLVGTRIVHLSDLHLAGQWFDAHDVLIDAVRDARADLVLITGDFVTARTPLGKVVPLVSRLLAGLSAKLGVFGVLGNHDRYEFQPHLAGMNIHMLDGQRQVVERDGCALELIGLPGSLREEMPDRWVDRVAAEHLKQPGVPRFVLSHYPDHIHRVRSLAADAFLAGHTHGGQICLPGGIPIFRHDSLPRRLFGGVRDIDGTWLVNNRGFGFTKLAVRMFCPNEVIEIELVRQE